MILAIDTSTRFLSVALATEQTLLAERSWTGGNQHSVEMSPAIEQMLIQTGKSVQELTAIAVAQGPGSFTGVRIGIGVAKGLAMALQIPLIAVPTLDIIAAGTPYFAGKLFAVIQAGRGRIIAGSYQWQSDQWSAAGELVHTTWEALVASIEPPALVNGEIDVQGHAIVTSQTNSICLAALAVQLRRAGFLAQIGLERLRQGETGDPLSVVPLYVKQP